MEINAGPKIGALGDTLNNLERDLWLSEETH